MEIQVDLALQRLAGNKALYVNLALCFPKDMAAMVSLFRSHLASGELGNAAGVLHNVKGMASTLGARELAELAARLGSQIKSAKQPFDAETACRALETLVDQTLTALDLVVTDLRPAPQSPAGADFDASELKAMLAELAPLLESRNMRALSVFARAQYKFGAVSSVQSSPHLGALAEAMNNLDFRSALESCRLLDAEFH